MLSCCVISNRQHASVVLDTVEHLVIYTDKTLMATTKIFLAMLTNFWPFLWITLCEKEAYKSTSIVHLKHVEKTKSNFFFIQPRPELQNSVSQCFSDPFVLVLCLRGSSPNQVVLDFFIK